MISKLRKDLKERHPLIHCITNPISINQCANAVLAVGARPMMAEHPEEVSVITANAGAVLLNMGNLTDVRKESIRISAKEANQNGIPFVLDVCGASCLPSRRDYALSLIREAKPTVIKGNYSEIMALCNPDYRSSGVDAEGVSLESAKEAARTLAKCFQTTVLASGSIDLITDGRRIICCYNGTPQLASITGTGCMQGALCAAYLAVADTALCAAEAAGIMLGVCGQLAQTDKGSGSFAVNLMDELSSITDDTLSDMIRLEEGYFDE